MIARRYIGNASAPNRTKPPSPSGVVTVSGSPPHTIRQKSAAMKDRPSVTSTCASWSPGRRRSSSRSASAPRAATASVARSAASQKFNLNAEQADDEGGADIGAQHEQRAVRQVRNTHQPEDQGEARRQQKQQAAECDAVDRQHQPKIHVRSVPALIVSMDRGRQHAAPAARFALRLERRVVARIDRLREELLLVVGPELADVVVGLDRLVDVSCRRPSRHGG